MSKNYNTEKKAKRKVSLLAKSTLSLSLGVLLQSTEAAQKFEAIEVGEKLEAAREFPINANQKSQFELLNEFGDLSINSNRNNSNINNNVNNSYRNGEQIIPQNDSFERIRQEQVARYEQIQRENKLPHIQTNDQTQDEEIAKQLQEQFDAERPVKNEYGENYMIFLRELEKSIQEEAGNIAQNPQEDEASIALALKLQEEFGGLDPQDQDHESIALALKLQEEFGRSQREEDLQNEDSLALAHALQLQDELNNEQF